eukprot:TRINITY_DN76966_c0_g1_i1.p1 TRINITY_DN76966_c0_g1~~TRINITY_DN76966_c0_g1_i1.p1  ORF type:complete len:133 (-),score=15.11 TRINITY_DN76966_c0_g1_i1:53-451(-)
MSAAVDNASNPWRRSTEAGGDKKPSESKSDDDFERMMTSPFCIPCRTDGLIPLSDESKAAGYPSRGGSSEGETSETAKVVEVQAEQPTTRRSTWIGRAAWSLGEYAADAMLPQCSCHDPLTGFIAHGFRRQR